jgi:hypothetical protein
MQTYMVTLTSHYNISDGLQFYLDDKTQRLKQRVLINADLYKKHLSLMQKQHSVLAALYMGNGGLS